MRNWFTVILIALMGIAVSVSAQVDRISRTAPPDASQVRLEPVASGFPRALYVTNAGEGSNRLFVVQQNGIIKIIGQDVDYLDVSGIISNDPLGNGYTERGLLGLAFHPNFETNGQFFINYTEANTHDSIVARYTVDPSANNVQGTTGVELLRVAQPFGNHNGGHMDFGPDGYLYVSLGDGGSQGDPMGHGQNKNTLLGSILRLDVDGTSGYSIPADNPFVGTDGADEVWAYGLRNVWRFSFDSVTGEMFMGDVGQNRWEEINVGAPSVGGANYGWAVFEASRPYSGAAEPADAVRPVAEYEHISGHCSVTGGYMYNGSAVPALERAYVYGDFCSGQLWALYRDANGAWQDTLLFDTPHTISSFGVDEAGELYLVDYGSAGSGTVYRFAAAN
ncbi:MAG: PQQ-dependent sugar dehydrogenase [Chloroflexota bacterium]